MNGLSFENLALGSVIAKNLPSQEQRNNTALMAGFLPANNPMGLLLVKKQVDTLDETSRTEKAFRQTVAAQKKMIGTLQKKSAEVSSNLGQLLTSIHENDATLQTVKATADSLGLAAPNKPAAAVGKDTGQSCDSTTQTAATGPVTSHVIVAEIAGKFDGFLAAIKTDDETISMIENLKDQVLEKLSATARI